MPAGASQDPFGACEKAFREAPREWASSRCFFQTGRRLQELEGSARRLERLRREHPENHWLACASGHVAAELGEDGVEEIYLAAADGFKEQENAAGEVMALQSLHHYLTVRGRLDDPRAGRAVVRAREAAVRAGDRTLLATVRVTEALHRKQHDQDLRGAYHLLREAEEALFPDGPAYWQRHCLQLLGVVALGLRREAEAERYFRRRAELARANGSRFAEAEALFGLALLLFEELERAPRQEGRVRLREAVEKALEAAESSGHKLLQVRCLSLLMRVSEAPEALFERCLTLAGEAGNTLRRAHCLRAFASRLIVEDPARSRQLLSEAEALAFTAGDPWERAHTLLARVPLSWAALGETQAFSDSAAALEAVESIRELQGAEGDRAGVLDRWHQPYYQLAGLQLAAARGELSDARLERALGALERARARALLDSMARPGGGPSRELREILTRRVDLQRRLLAADLGPVERRARLEELEKLEREEEKARARRGGGLAAATPDLDLAEVRSALGPERALLSYQLAPRRGVSGEAVGGSWLVVLTREGQAAHPLPDPHELEPMLSIYLGLLARRDGSDAAAAARLWEVLFQGALEALPPAVEHLILVPDGLLHRLPFASLRPAAEAPQLAARFELSHAPSITLWQEWSRTRSEPTARAALVLADPELPGMARQASGERAWAIAEGARLGPLPHARREGRALRRRLEGSRLDLGAAASEHRLKRLDLAPYGLLHLAAHAVIDELHPARSAVLLAAGDEGEDGLLQAPEITALPLAGKAVVLSACQGAAGALFKGEGVMSLSRAFFQAGAHAVVGSLWPLRDDEAAELFEAFYARLSTGSTMAEALASAQRERARAGAPAAAWAGLVVLGDGDLRPVAPSRPGPVWVPAVLALGLLGALLGWIRLRRVRP